MMKRALLLLLTGVCCQVLLAQKVPRTEKPINFGVKVGFNSAIPTIEVETESNSLTPRIVNKVGWMAESFMRMNVKKFYFQPEFSYSLTRESVDLLASDLSTYAKFDINTHSLDMSALLGYNTVKEMQYGLSVFAGLKTKAAYNIQFKSSMAPAYSDEDIFYNWYVTMGIGVNISRLFFDFRYDLALRNNDVNANFFRSGSFGDVQVKRKADILSFSIGFMF